MKSNQLQAVDKKQKKNHAQERITRQADKAAKSRLAKLQQLGELREKAEQELNAAASEQERQAAEKRLAALDKKLDCVKYGSYHYKRQRRLKREAENEERQAAKKQERLAKLDAELAELEKKAAASPDQAVQKQLDALKKKRERVELGYFGLRRKKAEAVQVQLDALQEQIRTLDQEIKTEKTVGAADPKTLKRLDKQKARLLKRERRLKDRIRALRQTRLLTMHRRKSVIGLIFVLPWIAGFLVLFLYPFVQSVRLSFGEITDMHNYIIEFTGLEHYRRLLFEEKDVLWMLGGVLKDTFINMILITVFSFYIAMLLNRKIKCRGLFRVICFLPVMLGTGFIMEQLLSQNIDQSSMNAVKDFLLPKEIIMYIGPKVTNAVVFFLNRLTVILWHSGVQILIFLSGLQSIPTTLYEAAKVDSATEWENLWFITVPMMAPMILLNLVYTVVDSFIDSSNPLITYIKDFAFEHHQESYAAAISMVYLVIALALIGLVFLVMRRFTKDMQS